MDKEEKFLPIGTVVLLKSGKRELMITGYCIIPNGEVYDKNGKIDGKGKMFDYGACIYPEGIVTSNQLFAFNHEQIEKVCFKGYETEMQKEFSKYLNGGLSKMQEAKENENTSQEGQM